MFYLDFLHFSQSTNSTADLSGSCCRVNPGTPSNSLATSITVPDANSCPLHGVLREDIFFKFSHCKCKNDNDTIFKTILASKAFSCMIPVNPDAEPSTQPL